MRSEGTQTTWLPQWIEIDGDAYRHNLRTLSSILRPGTRQMAVVKANAYGHGARRIVPLALQSGVDAIGVNALHEYAEISDLVAAVPVCLLGPTLPGQAAQVVAAGVEVTVSDLTVATALANAARAAARRVAIHIKVETGTHRQGISPEQIPSWCHFLAAHPEIRLRGLHTHYANIEDTTDHSFAAEQLARLTFAAARFRELEQAPELIHSACSAAVLTMESTHGDLARLGIATYGLWPSRETLLSSRHSRPNGPGLRPVLTWKCRITQLSEVAAGEYVGYGCSFRTTRAMRLALLPIGYYDGYDRRLSGRGHVLIRGSRAPVVGRVCMNLTLVDVSDARDLALGEEVVLLGRDGTETISADSMAGLCGTIHYEIVSRLAAHIPRFLRDVSK